MIPAENAPPMAVMPNHPQHDPGAAPAVERIEQLKQASAAQLLFRAARLWNEQAIGRLQQRFPAARLAHTSVLPHVDWNGTRITELAARMGVTKQAASQIVQDMVRIGLLELRPDAADGRARRVHFSPAGMQAMAEGLQTLSQMQQELAQDLGEARMDQLLGLLQELVPLLEARGKDSPLP